MSAAHGKPANLVGRVSVITVSGTDPDAASPYEVGRRALEKGAGLMELVAGYVQAAPQDTESLLELLAPYEMVISGYREANEQLRRINQRLQQANADLEAFGHAMAHDLRNPLATISMFASLARTQLGDGDSAPDRSLGMIEEVAGHALTLVADLLEYARLDRAATARVPVDLGAAIDRVRAALASLLSSSAAIVVADGLPTVRGRAGEVERLLQNLVENAVKYRGAADPRVSFEGNRDGRMWTVRCRDNGRGIPDHLGARAFEPFSRGETSLPGSGLGLAICRRVVERHGGQIWIEATGGAGTTIAFSLPAEARERSAPRVS